MTESESTLSEAAVVPAKLIPPEPGRYFARPALLEKLSEQVAASRKVWISSPGGAGKTSLVRHFFAADPRPLLWYQVDQSDRDPASLFLYLSRLVLLFGDRTHPLPPFAPEYLPNLEVFCRNFFVAFFANFPDGCVLVVDNLQDGPGETLFGPVLAAAMDELPNHSVLLVVSREEPYPGLARKRLNRSLSHLGWGAFRLTPEESRDFLHWLHPDAVSSQTQSRAYQVTQGWLAGLLLFLENPEKSLHSEFDGERIELLFDYFAGEIFDRLPPEIREFLLSCSVLPTVNPAMAEQLTGNHDADKILRALVRGNHFTFRISKNPETYRFHPLFHQFLLSTAEYELSDRQLNPLRKQAAEMLLTEGETEASAELLMAAHSWTALIELIRAQAEALLRQGRSQTLQGWLMALPEAQRNGDPWLCYWYGCCLLVQNPVTAREELEQAFVQFEGQGDVIGSMLAWGMAVYAIIAAWSECYRLDLWIERFDRLLARYPNFPAPQVEALMIQGIVMALTWRQPARADLATWAERLHQLIVASSDCGFRISAGTHLVFYQSMVGSLPKARALVSYLEAEVSNADVAPLQQLAWLTARAIHEWMTNDRSAFQAAMTQGRGVVATSGVHLMDLRLFGQEITLELTAGDVRRAASLMDKLPAAPPNPMDQSFLCFLKGDISLYAGDISKAIALIETAKQIAEDAGAIISLSFSIAGLALAHIQSGQGQKAAETLARGFEVCRGVNYFTALFLMLQAYFDLKHGKTEDAHLHLRRGFGLAAENGYFNFHPWREEMMICLCREALAAGIEVDYVRRLFASHDLDISAVDRPVLTPKELEVLGWIRQGKTNWEMAKILDIGERTVKFHATNILRKLDASSRSHALAKALEMEILPP